MIVPLYILGMLLRFGPQHGYQIKKQIAEQIADFTQIKLPTIYYHLEKMETAGLLNVQIDREGARPEKKIYAISESGVSKFHELLRQQLNIQYRPLFDVDAAFYFADYLDTHDLPDALEKHLGFLKLSLSHILSHRAQSLGYLPKEAKTTANIIFEHHIMHYQAEIAWAEKSMNRIREEIKNGRIKDN